MYRNEIRTGLNYAQAVFDGILAAASALDHGDAAAEIFGGN